MKNWTYVEKSGRYVIKDSALIRFPNFEGAAQTYNASGRKNFKLVIDETLASELKERGVYVRDRAPRNEDGETEYQVKVGVYPTTDVRLKIDGKEKRIGFDSLDIIDREFRKGHIENGEIGVAFHVSKNNNVPNGAYYLRVDEIKLPVRKSLLFDEMEDEEEMEEEPF